MAQQLKLYFREAHLNSAADSSDQASRGCREIDLKKPGGCGVEQSQLGASIKEPVRSDIFWYSISCQPHRYKRLVEVDKLVVEIQDRNIRGSPWYSRFRTPVNRVVTCLSCLIEGLFCGFSESNELATVNGDPFAGKVLP